MKSPQETTTLSNVPNSAIVSRIRSIFTRTYIASAIRIVFFAGLMWAAAATVGIPVPNIPVLITLQTFVVILAGLTLVWWEAGSAMLLYIVAGACGLPVFAGGKSIATLLGPSAGYVYGFFAAAIVIALLRGNSSEKYGVSVFLRYIFVSFVGAILVVYGFGSAWLAVYLHQNFFAMLAANAVFILVDIAKVLIASIALVAFNFMGSKLIKNNK